MQVVAGAIVDWGAALSEEAPSGTQVFSNSVVEHFLAHRARVAGAHGAVDDVGDAQVGLVDGAGEALELLAEAEVGREAVGHGGLLGVDEHEEKLLDAVVAASDEPRDQEEDAQRVSPNNVVEAIAPGDGALMHEAEDEGCRSS